MTKYKPEEIGNAVFDESLCSAFNQGAGVVLGVIMISKIHKEMNALGFSKDHINRILDLSVPMTKTISPAREGIENFIDKKNEFIKLLQTVSKAEPGFLETPSP